MFKKTLIAAVALSALALGASQAEAHGYGYGYGYGNGYGYHHSHYNSYSYYQPSCDTQSRPVTIRVWDDYSCEYIFRTVYRDYQVCG
jgi:hypothetical protein